MFGIEKKIKEIQDKVHRVVVISETAAIVYTVLFLGIVVMNIIMLVKIVNIENLLK